MAFSSTKNRRGNPPLNKKKLRELALYYNLAADRIVLLLNSFQKTPHQDEKFWKDKFSKWKERKNGEQTAKAKKEIDIETFAFLKNYLFYKKNLEQPGDIVTGVDDRWLMVVMIEKLFNLRNWHSHYCHNNLPLDFGWVNDEVINNALVSLKDFLNQHLEIAAEKEIKGEKELQEYYNSELKKSFRLFDDESQITLEGRIFFLQFFLTVGEMEKCIDGIKGFKRNKSPQWQLKRKIFSFYSKRDGSSALAFIFKSHELEEGSQATEVRNQLRQFSVFNEIKEYLVKKPAIICSAYEIEQWRRRNDDTELKPAEREKLDTIRPVNRFVHYALQYLLDFEVELGLRGKIEWRFRDAGYEKVTEKKGDKYVTKTKSKPVFGSREYAAGKLYITNGMAYFKFYTKKGEYLCSVNEQSLLYWAGSQILGLKQPEDVLKGIHAYVQQYNALMFKLANGEQPSFENLNKIKPVFLHTRLNDWINNPDEETLMVKYKEDIKRRIKSLIAEAESLTPETLQKMRAADKNRLLFKWYNYLLTKKNKLSHIRTAASSFSEVDNLSRFHYAPASDNGALRTHLISYFTYKFPVYLKDALTTVRHKNIDDIVAEVGKIVKQLFLFWQRITGEEKHPPEWQNTDKQPKELEAAAASTWAPLSKEDWDSLARTLGVGNPFLTRTRNASKEKDRRKELLQHFKGIAIQIPKQVFIDEEKITASSGQQKGDKHPSFAKQVREHPLSAGLVNSFYEIKPESDLPKRLAADKPGYAPGTIVKEILYTKTTDTLLWGICLAYQKKLFATGKISSTAKIDDSNITVSTIGQQQFNWVIAGKSIAIKQKQLRKMIFDFKLKEIEVIIRRGLNKEDTAESLEEVFRDNYYKSLQFIQRVLELEKFVLNGDCKDANMVNGYIDFNEIKTRISITDIDEGKLTLLSELRKSAFHANIPKEGSYTDGIEIIEDYFRKKGFHFIEFKRKEEE